MNQLSIRQIEHYLGNGICEMKRMLIATLFLAGFLPIAGCSLRARADDPPATGVVLFSDTFNDLPTSTPINGSLLNNGLGGTLSKTWRNVDLRTQWGAVTSKHPVTGGKLLRCSSDHWLAILDPGVTMGWRYRFDYTMIPVPNWAWVGIEMGLTVPSGKTEWGVYGDAGPLPRFVVRISNDVYSAQLWSGAGTRIPINAGDSYPEQGPADGVMSGNPATDRNANGDLPISIIYTPADRSMESALSATFYVNNIRKGTFEIPMPADARSCATEDHSIGICGNWSGNPIDRPDLFIDDVKFSLIATPSATPTPTPEATARAEMLFSDDFNSGASGASLGNQPLDNELGGSEAVSWISSSAAYATHTTGSQQACAVGSARSFAGYSLQKGKHYRLAALIDPSNGKTGEAYTAVNFLADSAQTMAMAPSGAMVRLYNAGLGKPRVDLIHGKISGGLAYLRSASLGSSDRDANGFYHVEVDFAGSGNCADPLEVKIRVHGSEKASYRITNLSGSDRIGFVAPNGGYIDDFCLSAAKRNSSSPSVYYVAVNGSDSWSGKLAAPNILHINGPFATIARAQQAVRREIDAGLQHDIVVNIRGGYYELDSPLQFTSADSGTREHSVTYVAHSGETPVIGGARRIAGWTSKGNDTWTTTVQAVKDGLWWSHGLYQDGIRLTRARFPNTGQYFQVTGFESGDSKKVQIDKTIPGGDLAGANAELNLLHLWSASITRVVSSSANQITTDLNPGHAENGCTNVAPGNQGFLEGAAELIDVPGEWSLDKSTGLLTLIMPAGGDPNSHEYHLARLTKLIDVTGSDSHPIRNLHFRGLHFAYVNWDLPPRGYAGIQADFNQPSLDYPSGRLARAIEFTNAWDCTIERCVIAHTGASGIAFNGGCRGNKVRYCELYDIGGQPISVGDAGAASSDAYDPGQAAMEISNNRIHDSATVQFGCVGIWLAFTPETVVAHNLIYNMPYSGISNGWCWNDSPSPQRDCRIEYNHIHDCMRLLQDGAGIYSLGSQNGSVIRNNLIHDIYSPHASPVAYSHGLYADQGTNHLLFENNIIYRTGEMGYVDNISHDNIIRNNIFACMSNRCIWRAKDDGGHSTFTVERNIIYADQGNAFLGDKYTNGQYTFDYNTYWDPRSNNPDFAGRTFAQWKAEGQDVHSQIANPGFANPGAGDFTMPHDSPVFALGFQPIDMSTVGPQEPQDPLATSDGWMRN